MLLSKQALLATRQLPTEDVSISTGVVRVRGLSGRERDDFEASIVVGRGQKRDINMRNLRAKLIVRTLIDDTGTLLLGEADIADVGNLPAVDADKLFDAARRLSGMTEQDVEELGKD